MPSPSSLERLVSMVQPHSRVLCVTSAPAEALERALDSLGCVLTKAAVPVSESPASPGFDTAILTTAPLDNWQAFGEQLRVTIPLLSDRGYLLVVVTGSGPMDRACLDEPLQAAGLIVGHAELFAAATSEDIALIVMAFPLPALDITVFRERARSLERRAQQAEHHVQRLVLRAAQLETDLEAAQRRVAQLDAVAAGEGERLATLDSALARAEAQRARLRADAEEARSRAQHAVTDQASLQTELATALAELEVLRVANADGAAQMQVLRQSFSWRVTTPIRALAGWLGKTTADRALGWRE